MLGVEEFHQAVEGVAIGALRVRLRRSGSIRGGPKCQFLVDLSGRVKCKKANVRSDDIVGHVTEIKSGFGVSGARSCDDLTKQRRHAGRSYLLPTK